MASQPIMPPHILMVTHVLPYPPAAGNEIRIYRMLRWLRGAGFHVTLILKPLGNEAISNECITGLSAVVDSLYVYDARIGCPESSGASFRLDAAEECTNLVNMQDGFCSPWFVCEIDALIRQLRPDVLIAEYIFMSRVFLCDAAVPLLKIIDTHDLFSRKLEAIEKYGITNFCLTMTADEEALLFRRADVLLVIQRLELDEIRCLVPDRQVLLTGFDVDIEYPDPALQENDIVLIVASDNEFNTRGTQDFLDYIWPLVREKHSGARLRLVGKVCKHVHTSDPSVEMVGFVRELSAEYSRARVVVNPCGVGTGLKIKTVEALSWGKAHVGWPASADGLREIADLPYVVAHDAVEFADAVAVLLEDTLRAHKLERAAHEFAERYLGTEATYAPLGGIIQAYVALSDAGAYLA